MRCDVCGTVASRLRHPCRFRVGCSCWRGVPCRVAADPIPGRQRAPRIQERPHGGGEAAQAIVETALVLPLLLFLMLATIEAAMLWQAFASQERRTGVLADYAAQHGDDPASWADDIAADLALDGCTLDVTTAGGLVNVGAACRYVPRVTRGLGWDGWLMSTEAQAVPVPTGAVAGATATPEATP